MTWAPPLAIDSARLFKIGLFFFFLFTLHIVMGYVFLRYLTLRHTSQDLHTLADRVAQELKYEHGQWNTSQYNSDPFTAYPNSSSSQPLYIITTDGFVIERSKPIKGLLDTSDFKHLMQFQQPQLLTTVTNEHWRVMSQPIVRDQKMYGVIMVSLYNPPEVTLDAADQQLARSLVQLDSVVKLTGDQLDVSQVDVRNLHYSVSFEIVDTFNKVLINDGRIPTFIDPSYVETQLNSTTNQVVIDEDSRQKYLTVTKPIIGDQQAVVAVVVAGQSIETAMTSLNNYLVVSVLFSLLLTMPLSVVATTVLHREFEKLLVITQQKMQQPILPQSLHFDKRASVLYINDTPLEIAYASNQYYLVAAVFSAPKKRWEHDELLETMGEDISSEKVRKIYDASLAINRKTKLKLIVHQDKTYFLNPQFVTTVV